MASKKLLTNNINLETANSFISGDNNLYVFAAKHLEYEGNGVETPTKALSDIVIDTYDNMIFGKKVSEADKIRMIRRVDWESGIVYAKYDDRDPNLLSKDYFVSVQEIIDGPRYVYKCIDNNNNAQSTSQPLYLSVIDNQPFQTADGYIWKYMYQIPNSQFLKFATNLKIPVIPDSNVTSSAIDGTIETLIVESGGIGYDNFYSSSFQTSSDIEVGGSFFFRLNSDASSIDDFYTGCAIKIISGTAEGQYRNITAYNGTTKIITIGENDDDPTTRGFSITPQVNDEYEITPYVYIFDQGGTKTSNCFARALVNESTGNSIYSVEVLNPGSGYRKASARIIVSNTVGLEIEANLRPIISPPGGHGSDVFSELDSKFIGISVKFSNNESATISTDNDFRSIGIIQNPLFNSINLLYSGGSGNFIVGEKVFQYIPTRLIGTADLTASNTAVIGTNTSFNSFQSGDYVLFTDNITNFLAQVDSVSNDTYFTVTNEPAITLSEVEIYKLQIKEFGDVSSISSGVLSLTNVNPSGLLQSNLYIGSQSFATLEVDTVQQNGDTINVYQTFEQLTKFVGSFSGIARFDEDELIIQDSILLDSRPEAYLHSISDDETTIYASGIKNVFSAEKQIKTLESGSGAIFNYTNKYEGDLVKDSGKILYLENLEDSITRSDFTSETIKIILEL